MKNKKYVINKVFSAGFFLWLFMMSMHTSVTASPANPREVLAPVRITEDIKLPAGTALRFEEDTFQRLVGFKKLCLSGFPLDNTETADLDLEQFEVTSDATMIVGGTESGDIPLARPEVVLFKGKVSGENDSDVVIGFSPYGNNGYIRKGDLLYFVSPNRQRGQAGQVFTHTIAERSECSGRGDSFQCAYKNVPETAATSEEFDCMYETGPFPDSYPWKVSFVAVETDNEYLDIFGGDVGAALAYVLQLAGTSSHFFERDMNIKWHLSYIRIWVENDYYLYDDGESTFNQLVSWWNLLMDDVDRDIVIMFSGRNYRWGYSLCPTLCNKEYAYTINCGLQGWFPRPVEDLNADNWDLHVVPHEAGHTFGSHHTHCYKPAIDNCADEGADSENPFCQDRTVFDECVVGTLMSYCGRDLCGGYANELMSFHPRVVNCIRDYVDAVDCLRSGLNPVYTDWRNLGDEDGSAARPFNTVTESLELVIPDGGIYIYSGSYPESLAITSSPQGLTINRPVTLYATGGPVTIGQ